MFCDLQLASFDAVDGAFDGTDVAITDIAAIDEDFSDADADNTNDDDDGDGVDDNEFDNAVTNDDNDADADCEISDVVISDFVTDKDGVIILVDDSSDDRGVVSGTELPVQEW